MGLTAYHAKLYAHELTKRSSSDNVDKLASVLSDAQVDLNPHQIEAALFAFRSPLSKGAILADEVGLGKTIEAGILLAQNWAERRRTLLVICPANLRRQWSQELLDKFFLSSVILETKTFNEAIRAGNLNPFQQPKIIICSFQFARSKESCSQRRLSQSIALPAYPFRFGANAILQKCPTWQGGDSRSKTNNSRRGPTAILSAAAE